MNSRSKGFVLGLISGAAIGSAVALLMAPDKGSNTRGRVSYRLNNYLDELASSVQNLRNKEDLISDAKKEGDKVVQQAQKKAEDLISEAEDLLKNISEKR